MFAEGYRAFLDHVATPMISVDAGARRIVSANDAFARLVGLGRRDLEGAALDALCPPDGAPCPGRPLTPELFAQPARHRDVSLLRRPLGFVTGDLEVRPSPRASAGIALAALHHDDERTRLEKELLRKHLALKAAHQELQSAYNEVQFGNDLLVEKNRELKDVYQRLAHFSKLAALGEMTAGVAHGINNPLASAVSAARQLRGESGGPRAQGLLDLLDRALERIEGVVEDLRRVLPDRPRGRARRPVTLADEVEMALSFLSHRAERVKVELDLAKVPPFVACAEDLHQILVNLLDNAMRAVEDGGTVRVGARTEEGAVVVKVEDDGPGVPAADRERIFEAFYTTRPAGQGTGLGLPVARGLAREGGGDLVLMETARGAVFELRLPAAERR